MKSTMLAVVALVVLMIGSVRGHGYMSRPRTRAELAFEVGQDYCPWCTSLWDVRSGEGLDQYQGRPYPGGRPFAQPGEAAAMLGPCAGLGAGGSNNYNQPGGPNRLWGYEVVDTFAAGDIVTVNWTANANHLGVYSYRICRDQSIVDRFLDPNYTPTQTDYFEAEACFQAGILPCNAPGLGNTNCASSQAQTSGCNDPSWGCADVPEWFGINDRAGWYVDRVRLPTDFSAEHTLLTWRWDVLDTAQIYFSCADIRVTAGDGVTETVTEASEITTTTEAPVVTTIPTTEAPVVTTIPTDTTPETTVPVVTTQAPDDVAVQLAELRAAIMELRTIVVDMAASCGA